MKRVMKSVVHRCVLHRFRVAMAPFFFGTIFPAEKTSEISSFCPAGIVLVLGFAVFQAKNPALK